MMVQNNYQILAKEVAHLTDALNELIEATQLSSPGVDSTKASLDISIHSAVKELINRSLFMRESDPNPTTAPQLSEQSPSPQHPEQSRPAHTQAITKAQSESPSGEANLPSFNDTTAAEATQQSLTEAHSEPGVLSAGSPNLGAGYETIAKIGSPGLLRSPDKRMRFKGKPLEFPVPSELHSDFYGPDGLQRQLNIDLEPLRKKLARISIREGFVDVNVHLWMSGRIQSSSDQTVTLTPHIWITCPSKKGLQQAKKLLEELSYPSTALGLPRELEYDLRGPEFRAENTVVPLKTLRAGAALATSLWYNDGVILCHIAKRRPDDVSFPSACSWVCCATYMKQNEVVHQQVFRIGGLLTSSMLGYEIRRDVGLTLTTAHGMLDPRFLLGEEVTDSSSDQRGSSAAAEDLQSADGFSDDGSETVSDLESLASADSGGDSVEPLASRFIGKQSPAENTEDWIACDKIHAVNYLGHIITDQNRLSYNTSDYAVIETDYLPMTNFYKNPTEMDKNEPSVKAVWTFTADDNLKDGPILLMLGGGEVATCHLLPGTKDVFLGGHQVSARTVQLEAPLAPGMSGAWLVRGVSFCGMVIASYAEEPLALMLTAQSILKDVNLEIPKARFVPPEAQTRATELIPLTAQDLAYLGTGPSRGHLPEYLHDEVASDPLEPAIKNLVSQSGRQQWMF